MSLSRVPALLLVLLGLALSTACGQIGEEPNEDTEDPPGDTSDAEACDNEADDDGDGLVDCDDPDCDGDAACP